MATLHDSALPTSDGVEPKAPTGPGDIPWSLAEFVVDGNGQLVARFDPQLEPQARAVVAVIESALG